MCSSEEVKEQSILLVDGDESVRDSLRMFFQGEGLRIDAVETAEEGLTALGKQAYDIIIAERDLPGMDGDRFLEHVRERCPEAFRILMSVYEGLNPLAAGLNADAYLEKPISAKLLKKCLARFTEIKR